MSILGNSYGVSPDGRTCKGCGKQEQFYGCADIAIDRSTVGSHQAGSYHSYVQQSVASRPHLPQAHVRGSSGTCTATPAFRMINQLAADNWCISNCRMGNCPSAYCNWTCQYLHVSG
jgi:hypothetical protein